MEVGMKKRILLGLAVLALTLVLSSCQDMTYEAYVTIVNIGNLPMNAWVEGDGAEIPAYDSQTWAVTLENKDEIRTVYLEAEPVGGGDSDEINVTLHGDRDVQTWLAGWDSVPGGQLLKKESSVVHGPAPSSVTSNQ
jgi:hypothetical protein